MLLGACTSGKQPHHDEDHMLGSDRDAHGCIGSAGYSWCEKTHQCERPWELAKEKGFPNTRAGFETYCSNWTPPVSLFKAVQLPSDWQAVSHTPFWMKPAAKSPHFPCKPAGLWPWNSKQPTPKPLFRGFFSYKQSSIIFIDSILNLALNKIYRSLFFGISFFPQ